MLSSLLFLTMTEYVLRSQKETLGWKLGQNRSSSEKFDTRTAYSSRVVYANEY